MLEYWQNPFVRAVFWMAVLEYIWLGNIGQPFYQPSLQAINSPNFQYRPAFAILAYGCMIISLYYFLLPQLAPIPKTDTFQILKTGALMGLVVYGTYNFTKHTIVEGWDLQVSLLDLAWGMTMYASVSYLTKNT